MSPISRRGLLGGLLGAGAAAVGWMGGRWGLASEPPPAPAAEPGTAAAATDRPVPDDPTAVPGPPATEVGQRSPFEDPRRESFVASSGTPLQDLNGTLTPADLHFERHHGGVAMIDPARYTLTIHGMVDRPLVLTLDDLKRFPSVSRTCFLECSGNFRRNVSAETPLHRIAGLTSQSEWTGVPLSVLFREAGVRPEATWFLAEGGDAGRMGRSIPVEKALEEGMVAWGQNGEALRPENGYPARLLLPGVEGNANVKWLTRMEFSDGPFMTRYETSRYTVVFPDGRARQFLFDLDVRSVITSPSYPARLQHGWVEIRGLAWSGRGRVTRAEVSFDEGATWRAADLQGPVLPKAHTRFRYLWRWTGEEATILSRAIDETGAVQPTQEEFIERRGVGSGPYHMNPIIGWRVLRDGQVLFRTEAWG